MDTTLNGRVALVTGASRGIGAAIAVALAGAGASVAVNYRERKDGAEALVQDLRQRGRGAVAVGADVSRSEDVDKMIHEVSAALGAIDILVNNAGIGVARAVEEITEAEFDAAIAVNLKSAFLCTQAVLPAMRAQKWGRIVNISSIAGRGPGAIGVHYNASKAGMEGLTRGYAVRLAHEGITVNAISPAAIETDMMRGRIDYTTIRIPVGRLGLPEEVAQAALMVIGNAYITGETIHVNGGSGLF